MKSRLDLIDRAAVALSATSPLSLSVSFTATRGQTAFGRAAHDALRPLLGSFHEVATTATGEVVLEIDEHRFVFARTRDGFVLVAEEIALADDTVAATWSEIVREAFSVSGSAKAEVLFGTRDEERSLGSFSLPMDPEELQWLCLDLPREEPTRVEIAGVSIAKDATLLFAREKHAPSPAMMRVVMTTPSRVVALGNGLEAQIGDGTFVMPDPVDTRRPSTSPNRIAEEDDSSVRTVFYATDRVPTGDRRVENLYGCAHDKQLHLGVCRVSVPKFRNFGILSAPVRWVSAVLGFDRRKHIVLLSSDELSEQEYFRRMENTFEAERRRRVFVFVHGFNVTFAAAVRRTAQIHCDLKFQGIPIVYSWPSRGEDLAAYHHDEQRVMASRWHLAEFLLDVARTTSPDDIHIVAHSMGNRVVTAALDLIAREHSPGKMPPLRQIVLAAPDLDAIEFEFASQRVRSIVERITLYGSSRDKALLASRVINQTRRAGEGGEHLCIVDGVDSIDASRVKTNFLGHGYVTHSMQLLLDIFQLVNDNRAPALRPTLMQRGRAWIFQKAE